MVASYEAGWSGFWLARWLAKNGIETHIQTSSVSVDRRALRAKSDGIDAELLLRTVPIFAEADEDARRRVRERAELVADRVGISIASVPSWRLWALANTTQSVGIGANVSTNCGRLSGFIAYACSREDRPLLIQITELEKSRDAVLEALTRRQA